MKARVAKPSAKGAVAAGQSLGQLPGGEFDAVGDRDRRTFVLRHAQTQLREREAARRVAILDALPAKIALLDAHGVIVSVNETWRRIDCAHSLQDPDYSVGFDYLQACDLAPISEGLHAHQAAAAIRAVLAGERKTFSIEYPCQAATGPRWFLLTVAPLGEDGAVVMHVDVSERRRGEEAVRRFADAMDATADAIYLVDRVTMSFVHVNEAACRMQGKTRAELLALGPVALLATAPGELEATYDAVIAGGPGPPIEMQRTRTDGSQVWVEVRRHAQRSDDRWLIVTLVRDITDHKEAQGRVLEKQERLDYLAYYDALTGLANRSLFLERVAQHVRGGAGGGQTLALYLLDLARFSDVNDSLGRVAGDALLKQVAEWLTRHFGDASLVGRVGADQFAIVLPALSDAGAAGRLVATAMAALAEQPFHLNDAVFRIAARGGVALFPADGADAETLFRNAAAALRRSKVSSERVLFYTSGMGEAASGRLTLERQLREALDRDEFVLHYQPKMNLATGLPCGVEALLRWHDPRTGLVAPERFIPILEETGLIHAVGRWVLRRAIADGRRWRAAGLAVGRIAVNVSPLQLRSPGFIAQLEQAIGGDAQAAAGLEIEITESVIMADAKHAIASLSAIRAMGVAIAIDDFGTGFSSLSYLSQLPVDTLKIDRSFVLGMTATRQGLALVSTIIGLGHALNLNVVAEGVETEEESRLLRLLCCDEMQGFLFSRPLPGEAFAARYAAGAPVP